MIFRRFRNREASGRAFLSALATDVRGNTLAMMAAFLIPLTALAGSAIDASRVFAVKARLQQACDAGALAGRKFLTDTSSATLDANSVAQANAFFGNNMKPGYMMSTGVTFSPVKTSDNQVSATATATVPMTVSRFLGITNVPLTVTCEARYDVADTDVMFVLDTTGSMACTTADGSGGCSQPTLTYTRPDGSTGYYVQEKSGSKLSGLRSAVLDFYDTVASNADPSTHIRYGFVTYTSTVNAGYAVTAVSPSYIVDNWTYDSRTIVGQVNRGSPSTTIYKPTNQTTCNGYAGRTPSSGYATNGSAVVNTVSWTNSNGGTCTVSSQTVTPTWRYTSVPFNTSLYKTGVAVIDPSKITGATSKWQGCLEERDTTAGATSFNINSLPADLDPDLVPSNDQTRWRPMWPDVIYYRGNNTSVDYSGNSTNPYGDSTSASQTGQYTNLLISNNAAAGYVSCGKQVQRLAELNRSSVSSYLNAPDFAPLGGTYHDTGMIWGTRLISPTGIFSSDTAAWPGRNPPNRYIVFMTDGDMAPNANIYGMYGMERYDNRVTAGNWGNQSTYINYHNARFLAECSAAKARNITVFVVGFGQTLTSQLTNCASPGQAYYASDNTSLQDAFKKIALQVARLRIAQ